MTALDDLVDTTTAAQAAGVAPATIRSWATTRPTRPKRLPLLTVAGRDRRGRPLYRLIDVLNVERDTRRRDQSGRALQRSA